MGNIKKQALDRMIIKARKASEEFKHRMFSKFKEGVYERSGGRIEKKIRALIEEGRYGELYKELSKKYKWHVRFKVLNEVSMINRSRLSEQEKIQIDDMLINEARCGGVIEALELIVEGADPQAKDIDGRTPIFWALEEGNKEVAQLLIKCIAANCITEINIESTIRKNVGNFPIEIREVRDFMRKTVNGFFSDNN